MCHSTCQHDNVHYVLLIIIYSKLHPPKLCSCSASWGWASDARNMSRLWVLIKWKWLWSVLNWCVLLNYTMMQVNKTLQINFKYFDRNGKWRETRSLRHWLYYVTPQKFQSAVCGATYYIIVIQHKAINIKYYDCMHFFVSYPSGEMHLNFKILPKALIIK
jgi:hypothetical protein